MDHIEGVPDLQKRFPDPLLAYNRRDYEDFLVSREWMEERFPEMVSQMKESAEFSQWFEYDISIFKQPDIYLEDSQVFELGDLHIRTILAPGHSSGSICFHVGEALFSGDVLFHRRVGRTDLLGGSKESIIASVRRLYRELPPETRVYPGHGEFTDIGSEIQDNEEVTLETATVQN
jgi:glyoxylase-like metal-dependent hydrolase (beta-lactamase superfamily II)